MSLQSQFLFFLPSPLPKPFSNGFMFLHRKRMLFVFSYNKINLCNVKAEKWQAKKEKACMRTYTSRVNVSDVLSFCEARRRRCLTC